MTRNINYQMILFQQFVFDMYVKCCINVFRKSETKDRSLSPLSKRMAMMDSTIVAEGIHFFT